LTHHLINHKTLAQMKPTAFVINTARGPIVDGDALKQALIDGVIAGAALDVYEDEPPTDLDLLTLPNLFCTPHIGGNADEAVMAMGMSAINHLKEFFGK
jgi:D-3-phosphoglycerate dehydrogenase